MVRLFMNSQKAGVNSTMRTKAISSPSLRIFFMPSPYRYPLSTARLYILPIMKP